MTPRFFCFDNSSVFTCRAQYTTNLDHLLSIFYRQGHVDV